MSYAIYHKPYTSTLYILHSTPYICHIPYTLYQVREALDRDRRESLEGKGRSDSPDGNGRSYSPDGRGRSYSPEGKGRSYSPERKGRRPPSFGGRLDSLEEDTTSERNGHGHGDSNNGDGSFWAHTVPGTPSMASVLAAASSTQGEAQQLV